MLEGGNDVVPNSSTLRAAPRTVVHTLQKGEVFGWAALVPPHQRTATARCVERPGVICLNGKDLMELLEKKPTHGLRGNEEPQRHSEYSPDYTTLVCGVRFARWPEDWSPRRRGAVIEDLLAAAFCLVPRRSRTSAREEDVAGVIRNL